jgi:molecular chaperone Hsp33
MPGAEPSAGDIIYERLAGLRPISELLSMGATPEGIMEALFYDSGLEISERYDVSYRCDCSREKMESGLISIGEKDLNTIIKEDGSAELCCHFCNRKYLFNEAELVELCKKAGIKVNRS